MYERVEISVLELIGNIAGFFAALWMTSNLCVQMACSRNVTESLIRNTFQVRVDEDDFQKVNRASTSRFTEDRITEQGMDAKVFSPQITPSHTPDVTQDDNHSPRKFSLHKRNNSETARALNIETNLAKQ